MNTTRKKRPDPGSIDEEAILRMVAGKSDRPIAGVTVPRSATATKKEKEKDRRPVVSPARSTREQRQACREFFQNVTREKSSRKSVHLYERWHEKASTLVWAIGRSGISVEVIVNRLMEEYFTRNEALLNDLVTERFEQLKNK